MKLKLNLLVVVLLSAIYTNAQDKTLELKEAVLEQYRSLAPTTLKDIRIVPNTEFISYQSNDLQTLYKLSVKTGKSETIITTENLNKLLGKESVTHFYSIEWNDNSNFIFKTKDFIWNYDIIKKTATKIQKLQSVSNNINVSPNGKLVAFTVDNDLYVNGVNCTENQTPEIVSGQSIARNEFGISGGIFWSPNSSYVAFYQKNEENVANYPLLDINVTPGKLNEIKYPMAGQGSEIPSVGVYHVASGKKVFLQTEEGDIDKYLTNLSWSPDEKHIVLAVVNRDQNVMNLQKFNPENGALIETILTEENEKWVEPEHPVYFINNSECVWLSEKDGFMNLYKINIDTKKTEQLTKNKWVVLNILGIDAKKQHIIYTGTGENATENHIYKLNLTSLKQEKLTTESGTHRAYFHEGSSFIIDQFSSLTVPNTIQAIDLNGKKIRNLHTSENTLKDYKIGNTEIFTIKSTDEKTDLYCRMIKPSNFDSNKKYPVLVYVYGGPHAQMVTNSWLGGASLWMHYLAEKGYIIFTLDNRGSANRGFEFESVIHRNLGKNEMEDQMKGIEYLSSLNFVNLDKLAIHGWSFGGFMTTSLMLKYPDVFRCGVAGGPVTDWKYYEVMYGERYMDTPTQNEDGYKETSLINHVSNLKGDLLLIHGTVDDVVVMQHNLALVKAFVDAEVQVDFFPYPMHPHNVRGKDRVHLMEKVLLYIEKSLQN